MVGSLLAAAALLVVASGLAKLRAPGPTATMFVTLIPSSTRRSRWLRPVARTAGGVEVAIGSVVLALGGPVPAVLLGACYLAFTAVAVALLRAGRAVSCGCFGSAGAPVGRGHVVLDVVGVAIAAAAIARPVPVAGGLLDGGPVVAVTGIAQALLLAWLGYLVITALPAVYSARRLVESA